MPAQHMTLPPPCSRVWCLLPCLSASVSCSDGIVRWVKKKTGPAAADLADKAALTAAEKEAEVIVLGYFTEAKVGAACVLGWSQPHMRLSTHAPWGVRCHAIAHHARHRVLRRHSTSVHAAFFMRVLLVQGDAYDAFISVAQKSEDASFVQTTKKDVAKAAGLSSPGIAVITNFEGRFAGGHMRLSACSNNETQHTATNAVLSQPAQRGCRAAHALCAANCTLSACTTNTPMPGCVCCHR